MSDLGNDIRTAGESPAAWAALVERGHRVGFRPSREIAFSAAFMLALTAALAVVAREVFQAQMQLPPHAAAVVPYDNRRPELGPVVVAFDLLALACALWAPFSVARGLRHRIHLVVDQHSLQVGRTRVPWREVVEVRPLFVRVPRVGRMRWLLVHLASHREGRTRPLVIRDVLPARTPVLYPWLNYEHDRWTRAAREGAPTERRPQNSTDGGADCDAGAS